MITPRRSHAILPMALAAALAAAAPARAQSDPNLPVAGVHQVGLLLVPAVQKELKLDEAQGKKVQELAQRTQEFMISSIKEIQAKPIQERVPGVQAMNTKLAADTKKGLADLLKPDQLKRLQQISLQERGGMSFAEPEVQDKLEMSENQRARIRSQVNEVFLNLRQMAASQSKDQQAMMLQAQEMRQRLADAIQGELSEKQKEAWKELIGAPFKVDLGPPPAAKPAAPTPQ